MKRLFFVLVVMVVGSHLSGVHAQANYRATYYGYESASSVHWLPFADGDSLGTSIYQGHEVPTTEDFLPVAFSCTTTWYRHAGQEVGLGLGTCTMVDDDGDWYRFLYKSPPGCMGGYYLLS